MNTSLQLLVMEDHLCNGVRVLLLQFRLLLLVATLLGSLQTTARSAEQALTLCLEPGTLAEKVMQNHSIVFVRHIAASEVRCIMTTLSQTCLVHVID